MADLVVWENSVLSQVLDTDHVKNDTGACSQVPISWAMHLYPGVPWSQLLPEAEGVDGWAGKSTKYFTWISNDANDKNQLPLPGDVIVFGATPAKGFTMQYENKWGHTGVIKSASASGYTLIEQNEPLGSGVHDGSYPWDLRPTLGWFRPVLSTAPAAVTPVMAPAAPAPVAPAPAQPVQSPNVGKYLNFPASVKSWWVYDQNGPYDASHHTHVFTEIAGHSREILKDLGNGVYVINSDSYGRVAVICASPLTVTSAPQFTTA